MENRKILTSVLLVIMLAASLVLAVEPDPAQDLKDALLTICGDLAAVLPIIGFVLFVLAGVAYAAGNFFSAEIRAKATSWAMNMIVGAIVAFLLWIVGPTIIGAFAGGDYKIGTATCTATV